RPLETRQRLLRQPHVHVRQRGTQQRGAVGLEEAQSAVSAVGVRQQLHGRLADRSAGEHLARGLPALGGHVVDTGHLTGRAVSRPSMTANAVPISEAPTGSRKRNRPCLPLASASSSTVVWPTGTLVSTSHGFSPHLAATSSTPATGPVVASARADSVRCMRSTAAVASAATATTMATTTVTFTGRGVRRTA